MAPLTGVHVADISVAHVLGLVGFLIVWIGLVECTKIVVVAVRNDPLIGWAISPLGISTLSLCEPSPFFILLSVILPALISAVILSLGLFTSLPAPLALPHYPLVILTVIVGGVVLPSTRDIVSALRDLRYSLWGEACVLCTLQRLRASWATIHFTPSTCVSILVRALQSFCGPFRLSQRLGVLSEPPLDPHAVRRVHVATKSGCCISSSVW